MIKEKRQEEIWTEFNGSNSLAMEKESNNSINFLEIHSRKKYNLRHAEILLKYLS
jgi:hypothetical protein